MKTLKKPGLYIHIPFCRTKCPYCGFYSVASTKFVARTMAALDKECDLYRNRFQSFDSLYLGGGTPTRLQPQELERMMQTVFSRFEFLNDTEMTIEANPADLTREKMDVLRALGFNRINLGVQSFDDRELSFLGRSHSGAKAKNCLKKLRSSGFTNIGVDLLYGFEGQSLKGWVRTLKRALEYEPEHLSCYQLTFEKGTPFWQLKETGRMREAGEDKARAFFLVTSTFLEKKGYFHYEISSFARGEAFTSRHNQKYWDHTPYLGLGPSAHSFNGSKRWWNHSSVRKYCEALERGKSAVEGYEHLEEAQVRLESVALGLRTRKGFLLSDEFMLQESKASLHKLETSGLIRIQGGRVFPTTRGMLVADHLPLCIFPG